MTRLLDLAEVAKFDRDGMLEKILNFPQQLRHARDIAEKTRMDIDPDRIRNVGVIGMGGSAMGGELVRSYVNRRLQIPFWVNRHYHLPAFVDDKSLVLVCSYSGNTEETLSAYEQALQRKAQCVCITSGGKLTERAKQSGHAIHALPGGFPPRAALAYLTIPILYTLTFAGIIDRAEADISDSVELLEQMAAEFHPDSEGNLAKDTARALQNKIPLIYAAIDCFDAVALRWKGQLSENSKVLAFCNVFPELNHNEIMGWGPLQEINKKCQVVYLRDRNDDARITKRMKITEEIIARQGLSVIKLDSRGQSALARIFSLIFLGDMISLYLAILNGVDPTEIANINFLKQQLSKES